MRIFSLVVLLVVGLRAAAFAGAPIVLESYTGEKPAQATQLLSPLLGELGLNKFVAGYEGVGRSFEERVSRPAMTEARLPTDFAKQVETGYSAWASGQFNEAVEVLGKMIRAARENPGAFARSPELRDVMFKALIAHALSTAKIGDGSAAEQGLFEIVRSYPNANLPRGTYGQQAVTDFEAARKKLGNKLGTLTVNIDVAGQVYVNERMVNSGKAITESLLPGDYRVFVMFSSRLSRVHKVTIKANSATVLNIDSGFEAAVRTTGTHTGFQFATKDDRVRNEARYAQLFGDAVDASGIVVAGIDQDKKREVVIGVLVNTLNASELKRAHVALEPDPSAEKLRALATFLVGTGTAAPEGVDVISAAPTTQVSDGKGGIIYRDASPAEPMWKGWKYITGGTAAIGLGLGAVFLYYDGQGTCPAGDSTCGDVYQLKPQGFISIGAGAALAGVTIYLFVRERGQQRDAKASSAFVLPTRGGALAGYAFSF
jgi:hypothetical protein